MQRATAVAPDIGRVTYLDPTGLAQDVARRPAPRLGSVAGKVAGLLDNDNNTSSFFFASLAEALESEYGVRRVALRTKFTLTRPAEPGLIAAMGEEADFLVAGVAL